MKYLTRTKEMAQRWFISVLKGENTDSAFHKGSGGEPWPPCLQFILFFLPGGKWIMRNCAALSNCLLSAAEMCSVTAKNRLRAHSLRSPAFAWRTKKTYAFRFEMYALIFNHRFIKIIFSHLRRCSEHIELPVTGCEIIDVPPPYPHL